MTHFISKKDIISTIAYCGISQSPYVFPKNLEKALDALGQRIDKKKIFNSKLEKSIGLEMIDRNMRLLVKDLIFNTPEIAIWNVTQVEQNVGITDPKDEARTVKFAGTSRYGAMQEQDLSFIDLDALSQNVCKMLCEAK